MQRFARAGLVILVTLAGTFIPTSAAQACLCVQLSEERMLRGSDAVFVGEVVERSRATKVKESQVPVPGGHTHTYTVAVDRVFKGDVAAETQVIAGGVSSMCGIQLQVGEPYLVFANTVGPSDPQGSVPLRYATSGCSGTARSITAPTSFGEGEPPVGAAAVAAPQQDEGEPSDNSPQVVVAIVGIGALTLGLIVGTAWLLTGRRRRDGLRS